VLITSQLIHLFSVIANMWGMSIVHIALFPYIFKRIVVAVFIDGVCYCIPIRQDDTTYALHTYSQTAPAAATWKGHSPNCKPRSVNAVGHDLSSIRLAIR
jgi:hypothetical protein